MRKYRVNFYSYFNGENTEKTFEANTTIFINYSALLIYTPIINNVFQMKPQSIFKIKGNKNEIDETRYNIFANKGIFILTKTYN
jgi:hypothetical protein